jgi:hypothetical protein
VATKLAVQAALALWVSASIFASVARAETTDGLDYEAPLGCADETRFIAAVAARGGDFANAREQLLRVRLQRTEQGFGGSLVVGSGGVTSRAREVQGKTCPEVVDALAVVTAIALDPQVNAPGAVQPTPTVRPAASAPTSRTAPTESPAVASPPRDRPPPIHAASSFGAKTLRVTAGTVRLHSRIDIVGSGGVVLGLVPGQLMPRMDVTATRANFVTLPNGESHLLGTIPRMRWSLLANRSFDRGDTAFDVGGQQLGVGLCASPYYHEDGWVFVGCAELAVGLLQFKVREPGLSERTETTAFGQFGVNAEASYRFGRHFVISAKLALEAPESRVRLRRADGSDLFRSSAVMGSGTLGLGGSF